MAIVSIRPFVCVCAAVAVAAVVPWSAARASTNPHPSPRWGGATRSIGDWPTYNLDAQNDRFSPLTQISTANVAGLHPICTATLSADSDVGFEAGPIVVNGILYATTIHTTYAINAATCASVWTQPTGYPSDAGLANRGAAYANGAIFRGTLGNHVIAYSALTGHKVWDTGPVASPPDAFITASPIVWRNAVYVGLAGADDGSKGAIIALDQTTGAILWQTPTVPADPLSGTLPLSSGWGGASHVAGGSTWSSYTVDPERGLLLVSTGNPAPDFFGAARLGPNASTDSLLVLNASTGQVLEQYQFDAHDVHDYDIASSAAFSSPLATAFVAGKDGLLRSVRLGQPNPAWTTKVTTVDNIPAAPVPGLPVHFCPGTTGGVEWNGPAYSATAHAVFVNSVDKCVTVTLDSLVSVSNINNGDFQNPPVFVVPGAPWVGTTDYSNPHPNAPFGIPDGPGTGHVTAVDSRSGRRLWQFNAPWPMVAGITPTAGGVVFTADLAGDFYAFNAATGAVLNTQSLGEPVGGGVITYAVGGTQFVAVAAGMSSPLVWQTSGTNQIVVMGL